MGLLESGKIKELSCGTDFAYIIQEKEDFSITEYKVLQSQNSSAFIKCMKLLFNGKTELYYQTGGLRTLTSMLTSIDGDGFMTIISNLFTAIIEVKANGFLACQNIDISFDKIYIDPTNYMVRLVYIPTKTRGYESYSVFENELRTSVVRILGSTPSLSSPKTMTLSMDLIDGGLSLESLTSKCKTGVIHSPSGIAKRSVMPTPQRSGISVMREQSAKRLRLEAPSQITFDIHQPEFVIGKNSSVDGVISFNTAISRYHCKVICGNGEYFVEDLGSSNGTYVNRTRLEPNKRIAIHNGDWLRLADMDFQVCIM